VSTKDQEYRKHRVLFTEGRKKIACITMMHHGSWKWKFGK